MNMTLKIYLRRLLTPLRNSTSLHSTKLVPCTKKKDQVYLFTSYIFWVIAEFCMNNHSISIKQKIAILGFAFVFAELTLQSNLLVTLAQAWTGTFLSTHNGFTFLWIRIYIYNLEYLLIKSTYPAFKFILQLVDCWPSKSLKQCFGL